VPLEPDRVPLESERALRRSYGSSAT